MCTFYRPHDFTLDELMEWNCTQTVRLVVLGSDHLSAVNDCVVDDLSLLEHITTYVVSMKHTSTSHN